MSYFVWLPIVAFAGWISGQIAGDRGYGRVADALLGICGGFLVRFVVEAMTASLEPVYLLLFSMWGAAAGPAIARFFLRRRHKFAAKFAPKASPAPGQSQTSGVASTS
jgi:uncharacterized membrane protein YeaQ/YmgE (transglycosylase-associated protein family)